MVLYSCPHSAQRASVVSVILPRFVLMLDQSWRGRLAARSDDKSSVEAEETTADRPGRQNSSGTMQLSLNANR